MLFNEKQLKILQEASRVLTQEFDLKNEAAMKLIADGLSTELSNRSTNMETIVKSHRTVQISFIQDVVRTIQKKIADTKQFPPAKVAQATEKFRSVLDTIWTFE
jgi:hypothetical protein